jgi:glutamine cyclotransferase
MIVSLGLDVCANTCLHYREGLAYGGGVLYESIGLEGKSEIRALDKVTGNVIQSQKLRPRLFAEGLTVFDGKAVQLTYKHKLALIYDLEDLTKSPDKLNFDSTTGEGWGLTYRPGAHELLMSDGSEFIHVLDPETLELKRKFKVVRQNDKKSDQINELEWFNGRILANVWYEDVIIVIDPDTGIVEKEYGKQFSCVQMYSFREAVSCLTFPLDFSMLWQKQERKNDGAGVLNGISIADHPGQIYVTGKNWNRMYLIEYVASIQPRNRCMRIVSNVLLSTGCNFERTVRNLFLLIGLFRSLVI